jgi:phosphohistidine phosphatase
MDLILWRHAEAQEHDAGLDDLDRALTSRGEKQARRMAAWLDRQLPEGTRILVSPALRTVQTAQALERKFKLCPALAPDCSVQQLLAAAQWPDARHAVLLIGHQPTLGQAISQLVGLKSSDCSVKRGAVWWLRNREREAAAQTVVVTVQAPDTL